MFSQWGVKQLLFYGEMWGIACPPLEFQNELTRAVSNDVLSRVLNVKE